MTIKKQIKKATQEITGEKCELCGNPLKVFISHREQDGIVPVHLTVRVACPVCEAEADQCNGLDDMEEYCELNHLETGGTLHGMPDIIKI